MTYNEQAMRFLSRIEHTLATLSRWTENELSRLADTDADSLDVSIFEHVSEKLDRVEDAWSTAAQLARAERALANARDERETYADAFGPAVQ